MSDDTRIGDFSVNPFKGLKKALEKKNVKLKSAKAKPSPPALDKKAAPPEPKKSSDEELFREAMRDVRVREDFKRAAQPPKKKPRARRVVDDDEMHELRRIVTNRAGITLSDTDEYLEYAARGIDPDMGYRLHMGEFAVQDSIDLHGLTEEEARQAFADFMIRSREKGLLCIKVVHGRGLRSPGQPVLKSALVNWLRSTYKNRVRAFATARSCDGGLGATYVLMRYP